MLCLIQYKKLEVNRHKNIFRRRKCTKCSSLLIFFVTSVRLISKLVNPKKKKRIGINILYFRYCLIHIFNKRTIYSIYRCICAIRNASKTFPIRFIFLFCFYWHAHVITHRAKIHSYLILKSKDRPRRSSQNGVVFVIVCNSGTQV